MLTKAFFSDNPSQRERERDFFEGWMLWGFSCETIEGWRRYI